MTARFIVLSFVLRLHRKKTFRGGSNCRPCAHSLILSPGRAQLEKSKHEIIYLRSGQKLLGRHLCVLCTLPAAPENGDARLPVHAAMRKTPFQPHSDIIGGHPRAVKQKKGRPALGRKCGELNSQVLPCFHLEKLFEEGKRIIIKKETELPFLTLVKHTQVFFFPFCFVSRVSTEGEAETELICLAAV